MHRRGFLATLVAGTAGVSGCAELSNDGDSTATPTDSATPTKAMNQDDSERRDPPESHASVIELANHPHTLALSPTRLHTDDGAEVALWFDRTATNEHPARITGYLENRNDFVNTFQVKWIPIVGRTFSRQPRGYRYEASLFTVPTENNEIAEATPDVSQTADGHWIVEATGSWIPELYRLEPGERVQLEYVLVGHPEIEERPTGTYEFRGRGEQIDITVWETDSPGPATKSHFAGRSVPPIPDTSPLQWYHEADATTGAYVEPSTERLELDGLVEFEMVNHTHEMLQCGHWNLYKLVDGEWHHVGPFMHTDDCRGLPPGGTKEWALRAFNGDAVRCGSFCGGGGFTRGFLGGGEYAVVAGYGHPEETSGALIELIGEPTEFTVTDDATVQREGDTVTVTTDRYGDGVHPPDASFALTRVDSAGRRVIPEQIATGSGHGVGSVQEVGLRNALAVMDSDVDRVIVRADEHIVDRALGHDQVTNRFELRGQAYQAERLSDNQ